jgi:putative OPT family oligopeptide transporter
MYYPVYILQVANVKGGGTGFGDPKLPAPQAGLMAVLAQGIVGGDMPWPLVVTGILFGLALILLRVRSPMLVAVGMYLPIATTFAIFVGGMLRWASDSLSARAGNNFAQKARVESVGILIASGLIAGEALTGLVVAYFKFRDLEIPQAFASPSYLIGLIVMALLGVLMIRLPLSKAGRPEDPAPPTAIM